MINQHDQHGNKNTILNSKSSSLHLTQYYINATYYLLQMNLQIRVLSLSQ